MKPYDDHVVGFLGEEWAPRVYQALYHLRRGEVNQDNQNPLSGNRCQHLLTHYVGTNVHQLVEGDHFHTTSSHEVPVGIGKHSHDACRSESGTRMLRIKLKGGAYTVGHL